MTVEDLIVELGKFDRSLEVMLPGLMGGLEELTSPHVVNIVRDVYHREDWRGRHESLETVRKFKKQFLPRIQRRAGGVMHQQVIYLSGASHVS
ncbi:MAG TPA: hypothetical protein V6C86_15120 [Oculatellaceae cyanobacterium]